MVHLLKPAQLVFFATAVVLLIAGDSAKTRLAACVDGCSDECQDDEPAWCDRDEGHAFAWPFGHATTSGCSLDPDGGDLNITTLEERQFYDSCTGTCGTLTRWTPAAGFSGYQNTISNWSSTECEAG